MNDNFKSFAEWERDTFGPLTYRNIKFRVACRISYVYSWVCGRIYNLFH